MNQVDGQLDEYAWRSDYQLIGAGFAALLLMAAALAGDAYSIGFYSFLRIVVTLVSCVLAWRAHQHRNVLTAVLAGALAILFNPILPIELERSTWQPIDFIVALWFGWIALENLASAKGKRWIRFLPVLGVIAIALIAGVAALIESRRNSSSYDSYPDAYENFSEPVSATPETVPTKSPEERLADAFEAATGVRDQFVEMEDGNTVTTTALKIVDLPFGPALLTRREIKDGCHACTGAIGIFYLKEENGVTTVSGRWPKAVEGWGWGAPPADWNFTDKFTKNPAIYASGGYMGQGIVMESATITELTPSGPQTSDYVGTGFSDEGAIADESRTACVVKGKIANIRKDQSFDVIISGSVAGVDRYTKRDGKFVKSKAIDWGTPCPDDPTDEPASTM